MITSAIQNFITSNKYPRFECKAVFFDMDGVLFDSMPFHATAWVRALNEVGMPFSVTEAYLNEGRTGGSTIDGVYNKELNRNATDEEKKRIYALKSKYFEEIEQTVPMPYAFELLKKVKSKNQGIYLVTGSAQPKLLDGLHLAFPGIFRKENMITAFDVEQGKPHPEPYLKALKRSGLQPWQVVVIENAPLGVASAKAAGLFTVAVNTGPLPVDVLFENGADIVLESMEDLFSKWESYFC
jgi:HAD superfamily hydrolase (TIGR01509 family)